MTKIETLKNSAKVLFGGDTPTINGEEYLALLDGAQSQDEKEFIRKSIIIYWQNAKKK